MNFLQNIEIKIASGLASKAFELITFDRKICFVSDEKIWKNCAKFFADDFKDHCSETLILKNAQADEKNIAHIKKAAQNCDLIVALGSGVINDLCKMVSARERIPYVIFLPQFPRSFSW